MRWNQKVAAAAGLSALLVATAGCAGAGGAGGGGGGGGGGDNSINVLMVNNPQMLALQKHAGEFTKESGIAVNFTVKPENEMRNQAAQEFANQSGQFDVATLSNFEIPWMSKNNWIWALAQPRAGTSVGRFALPPGTSTSFCVVVMIIPFHDCLAWVATTPDVEQVIRLAA